MIKDSFSKVPKNSINGFTIIEVVVALFLLTVGVFGGYALFQQTVVTSALNQSRLVAFYMTQELFETVRNIRDSNWLVRPVIPWDTGMMASCMSPRFSPCDFYADANVDGVVNSVDSNLCTSCIQEGDVFCQRCDVDGDGSLSGGDVSYINDYISCFSNTFPVCSSIAKFQRQVTITLEDPSILKASSTVSWTERGRSYSVSSIDYLYNWRD
jgi:Tfp pilus assembly protein PilV